MTLVSVLLVGFVLGMKHALESDHLAAVATLATQQHSWASTARQGIAWGIGHALTLLMFGGVVLMLGRRIPARMEQGLEFAVGVMLIALGVDVLRRVKRQRIHLHVHRHDNGLVHVHAHAHAGDLQRAPIVETAQQSVRELPKIQFRFPHRQERHEHPHVLTRRARNREAEKSSEHSFFRRFPLRALAVGMMHGMAGSAAPIFLSLQAAPSLSVGLLYIVVFGMGSIAGMCLLSVAIALPLRLSQRGELSKALTGAVGVATVLLGMLVIYRIGVGGLLSGY